MSTQKITRWIPAVLTMGLIFWISSQPSSELPDLGWVDFIVKKSGHVFEYAVLSIGYWYAYGFKDDRRGIAWLFAILYAMTDEFHQSFVPGRIPSLWDVLIFDHVGVLLGLWLANRLVKQ
ncbi:MAG TPA: VanZ family protein [Anaerolineales bacterium]|nr:VanZ family protein [Anaerolineales bacterium]